MSWTFRSLPLHHIDAALSNYSLPRLMARSSKSYALHFPQYVLTFSRRHPREPSNLGRSNNSISSTNSQVYTTHDNGYANQSTSDPRTRSATVCPAMVTLGIESVLTKLQVSGDGVRQDSNVSFAQDDSQWLNHRRTLLLC